MARPPAILDDLPSLANTNQRLDSARDRGERRNLSRFDGDWRRIFNRPGDDLPDGNAFLLSDWNVSVSNGAHGDDHDFLASLRPSDCRYYFSLVFGERRGDYGPLRESDRGTLLQRQASLNVRSSLYRYGREPRYSTNIRMIRFLFLGLGLWITFPIATVSSSPYLIAVLSQETIEIPLFYTREPLLIAGTIKEFEPRNELAVIATVIGPGRQTPAISILASTLISPALETLPPEIQKRRPLVPIQLIDQRLFLVRVLFPDRLPSGLYRVTLYLFNGSDLLEKQEIPLKIEQVGWGRQVALLAHDGPLWYACLAVVGAFGIGWISYRWI